MDKLRAIPYPTTLYYSSQTNFTVFTQLYIHRKVLPYSQTILFFCIFTNMYIHDENPYSHILTHDGTAASMNMEYFQQRTKKLCGCYGTSQEKHNFDCIVIRWPRK